MHTAQNSIAIIGGGITGLAAAYYLARRGFAVSIFEESEQWGGLGTFFEHEGRSIEKFYHCMLPSDAALLSLLEEIGLKDRVYWSESKFSILSKGRFFPLNTPLDLLNFSLLPFLDRIRLGLTAIWGRVSKSSGLDEISAESWLTKLSGKRAFDAFWRVLLRAKFGDNYRTVPALWFWTRFNREKGGGKERKGYIRGGYRTIIEALIAALEREGVKLFSKIKVREIAYSERSGNSQASGAKISLQAGGERLSFSKVIITTPLQIVPNLLSQACFHEELKRLDTGIDSQGVINVLFLLRRGLSPYYWAATLDSNLPFQGIVESSLILNEEDRAGLHRVYLTNYLHRNDPMFSAEAAPLEARCWTALKELFPELNDSDRAAVYTFRTPHVEPIYTLGFKKRQPPVELVPNTIFLLNTAQVYPRVTSWNGALELVQSELERVYVAGRSPELSRHD